MFTHPVAAPAERGPSALVQPHAEPAAGERIEARGVTTAAIVYGALKFPRAELVLAIRRRSLELARQDLSPGCAPIRFA